MPPVKPSSLITITGTLRREVWRSPNAGGRGNHFVIASIETTDDKLPVSIKGDAAIGELTPGLAYKFIGQWEAEHPRYGKSFKFQGYEKLAPHTRRAVVEYLKKYADGTGIGPGIAGYLFDALGGDAIKTLRNTPEEAAVQVNVTAGKHVLSNHVARAAAVKLKVVAALEDTRIELANLLNGRGFPGSLTEELIRRWGPLAPVRIKRDPLSLMVLELPGCGFTRVDRLYCDLGLPPGKLKRQMLCVWYALGNDKSASGHTWMPISWAKNLLNGKIGGAPVRLDKSLRLGVRSGWLAVKQEESSRLVFVALADAANDEWKATEAIRAMSVWAAPESCGLATPAEYAEWLGLVRTGMYGAVDVAGVGGITLADVVGVPAAVGGPGRSVVELGGDGAAPDLTPTAGADGDVVSIADIEIDTENKTRLGRLTGICQFCGRVLVTSESRRRGCGPVCAERWGVEL